MSAYGGHGSSVGTYKFKRGIQEVWDPEVDPKGEPKPKLKVLVYGTPSSSSPSSRHWAVMNGENLNPEKPLEGCSVRLIAQRPGKSDKSLARTRPLRTKVVGEPAVWDECFLLTELDAHDYISVEVEDSRTVGHKALGSALLGQVHLRSSPPSSPAGPNDATRGRSNGDGRISLGPSRKLKGEAHRGIWNLASATFFQFSSRDASSPPRAHAPHLHALHGLL